MDTPTHQLHLPDIVSTDDTNDEVTFVAGASGTSTKKKKKTQ